MNILAFDLDRTLIFSGRFLKEHNNTVEDIEVVEKKKDTDEPISYISKKVLSKLKEIKECDDIKLVAVTSRSLEEVYRLSIYDLFDYIISDCGGMLFKGNIADDDYSAYIESKPFRRGLMDATMFMSELKSVTSTKIRDGLFLFGKTDNKELFDYEASALPENISSIARVNRVGNKWYCIPEHFNKGIALRFLQDKLKREYGDVFTVASGDSLMDITMFNVADEVTVPKHGELVQEKIALEGNFVDGGIESPLETIDFALNKMVNR